MSKLISKQLVANLTDAIDNMDNSLQGIQRLLIEIYFWEFTQSEAYSNLSKEKKHEAEEGFVFLFRALSFISEFYDEFRGFDNE